jgi:DNA-binding NarL/FixJ family response regulator
MNKISIIIIEDNRLLRESTIKIFSKLKEINVIGSFEECDIALKSISKLKPDIILSDLDLHNQNSLKFVKKLKNDHPEVKVVVMDIVPSVESVLLLIEAGVSGFILKDADSPDIFNTIRSVANGEKVLPSILTESLFSQIVDKAVVALIPASIKETIRMTKRESEMMDLVANGFSNKEIAENLNLSVFTVKSHIHNILEKLAFNTRVQIANYAHTAKKYKNSENDTLE